MDREEEQIYLEIENVIALMIGKYVYKRSLREMKKAIGWYNLGLRDDIISDNLYDIDNYLKAFYGEYYSWLLKENDRDRAQKHLLEVKELVNKIANFYEFSFPTMDSIYNFSSTSETELMCAYDKYFLNNMNRSRLMEMLSDKEKQMLSKPKIAKNYFVIINENGMWKFRISKKGMIIESDGSCKYKLEDMVNCLLDNNIIKKRDTGVKNVIREIDRYNKRKELREMLLKAIMFKIFDNGRKNDKAELGFARAILFAITFGDNYNMEKDMLEELLFYGSLFIPAEFLERIVNSNWRLEDAAVWVYNDKKEKGYVYSLDEIIEKKRSLRK